VRHYFHSEIIILRDCQKGMVCDYYLLAAKKNIMTNIETLKITSTAFKDGAISLPGILAKAKA